MQVAAFAVPPDAGELKYPAGAADQQLLHGEFRAGMQPHRLPRAVGILTLRAEGAQMHLFTRRRNGVRRFYLRITARAEETARSGSQQAPPAEERQARRETVRTARRLHR